MTLRLVVVDDQDLVRAGFVLLLDSAPDIEVVGQAADGREAVAVVSRERPDLVLMDIRMPVMDGIEATRRIRADLPDTEVLILTTFDTDEYAYRALQAGASGFLLKDTPPQDLLRAIAVAGAGGAVIAPSTTRRLLTDLIAASPDPERRTADELQVLTGREREVLELVARGDTNAQIGDKLFISEATVKTHVSRIMTKLNLPTRAHAVVLAYETGLVVPRGG